MRSTEKRAHTAAREQVGLTRPHFNLPPRVPDSVDHNLAGAAGRGIARGACAGRLRRGSGLLKEGDGEHGQRH